MRCLSQFLWCFLMKMKNLNRFSCAIAVSKKQIWKERKKESGFLLWEKPNAINFYWFLLNFSNYNHRSCKINSISSWKLHSSCTSIIINFKCEWENPRRCSNFLWHSINLFRAYFFREIFMWNNEKGERRRRKIVILLFVFSAFPWWDFLPSLVNILIINLLNYFSRM